MRLKNVLIVVEDIERSKAFYKELFGLEPIRDFGGNVILTDGLVLQEKKLWQNAVNKDIVFGNHSVELYFEENDMDAFQEKLINSSLTIEYVTPITKHEWGQRVVRIYDPDKHVIEVGEKLL